MAQSQIRRLYKTRSSVRLYRAWWNYTAAPRPSNGKRVFKKFN